MMLPWLTALSVLLLCTGTVWGLLFAPPDYQQGNSYRIIYMHVPSSILAQSSYMIMAVVGAIGLIWKIKLADVGMKCCAPIGASLAFLSIATGAIWGKPTWGTWWVWDARLTSMLILLFLFMGIIALRSAMEDKEAAGKACAILGLVGMVNIPIIKFSVEWWKTLHQPSSIKLTEESTVAPEMLLPLLVMVLGFYCFFFTTWIMRMRTEILARELRTQWVRDETRIGARKRARVESIMKFGKMKPHRKRRLFVVVFIVAASSVSVGLALLALNENLNLFFSPEQIHAGEAPVGKTIRAGGLVMVDSLHRDPQSLKVGFDVTDLKGSVVRVEYMGILPDLFREGQGVIALGQLDATGIFHADEVLAKHDEKYMPPELEGMVEEVHPTGKLN
jgi:heme exporter protein C